MQARSFPSTTSPKKVIIRLLYHHNRDLRVDTCCNNKSPFSTIIFYFRYNPFRGSQKLPMPTVFHVDMAGYWEKFSTSNSHASVEPHWLWHCLCAKLKNALLLILYTTVYCSYILVFYADTSNKWNKDCLTQNSAPSIKNFSIPWNPHWFHCAP